MTPAEFRAVLTWWMLSDPIREDLRAPIFEWLTRESQQRGYDDLIDAYHKMPGT